MVSCNLTIEEIIKAKDYSLAEVARPVFGKYGVWVTVGIATIETISSSTNIDKQRKAFTNFNLAFSKSVKLIWVE